MIISQPASHFHALLMLVYSTPHIQFIYSYNDKIATGIAFTDRSRAGAELDQQNPAKMHFSLPTQVIRTAAGCVFQSVWNFTVVTRHSIALCIFEHFVLLLCVQRCLLV